MTISCPHDENILNVLTENGYKVGYNGVIESGAKPLTILILIEARIISVYVGLTPQTITSNKRCDRMSKSILILLGAI